MEEKENTGTDKTERTAQKWWQMPFDGKTNFSLLGWLLDKFNKKSESKENVDLTLEE